MTNTDFVSIEEILSDLLYAVDDVEQRNGLAPGWYKFQVRKALKNLAYDTFFATFTLDIDMNQERLAIELPKGVFNLREIYVHNGSCCGPGGDFKVVHWKRLHNNKNDAANPTSRIKQGGQGYSDDPFLHSLNDVSNRAIGDRAAKYYANTQNDVLMFSPACGNFKKVRIVFNGINGDLSTVPIVPSFLEEAVIDFVKIKYYQVMKARNPRKYRTSWMDAKDDYYNLLTGSRKAARMRIRSMDTWEKESLEEYLSSLIHK